VGNDEEIGKAAPMSKIGSRRRRAVTFVELMTVITIIAIFASVALVGGKAVFVKVNNLRIIADIRQFSDALEEFARRFGDYPPDFHDAQATENFLRQAFPACPPDRFPDLSRQSPASSLYFWLAGPNGKGFSNDPRDPFGKGTVRIGPFCQFKPDRTRWVDGAMQYFPPQSPRGGVPYIYFRADKKGYDGHAGWPPASPYRESVGAAWINSDSYQILCAGEDGKLGSGCHYPRGEDYDEANRDDISNFSGGTMRQAMSDAVEK
jgi:prepilin-type N-terminal cleavage/methylation domain-containing protein